MCTNEEPSQLSTGLHTDERPVTSQAIPVCVINLRRHSQRRTRIETRLRALLPEDRYAVRFIEAVDGEAIGGAEALETTYGCRVSRTWRDPYRRRGLTWGEVGCFLSHRRIYREHDGDGPVVVLEDDVSLEDDFEDKLALTLRGLAERRDDWGVCYLGRKPVGPDGTRTTAASSAPWFVDAGYSYWTCGYVVSARGREVLATYRGPVIPIDELIPMLGGVSPHGLSYLGSVAAAAAAAADGPVLPLLSVRDLIVRPLAQAFQSSSTENSRLVVGGDASSRLLVLAVGTDMTDGLRRFVRSCERYCLRHRVLGLGQKWRGGDMASGPGGGHKIVLLREALANVPDDTLVLVTDSYDVIMTTNEAEITSKFAAVCGNNSGVLFASESSCWPDRALADRFPPHPRGGANRFLNSGGFIGRAGDVRCLLPSSSIDAASDDQRYYTSVFLGDTVARRGVTVTLDYECRIFQCLNDAENNLALAPGLRIRNTRYDTRPCHVHGNGPLDRKVLLNWYENYLLYYDSMYGFNAAEFSRGGHHSDDAADGSAVGSADDAAVGGSADDAADGSADDAAVGSADDAAVGGSADDAAVGSADDAAVRSVDARVEVVFTGARCPGDGWDDESLTRMLGARAFTVRELDPDDTAADPFVSAADRGADYVLLVSPDECRVSDQCMFDELAGLGRSVVAPLLRQGVSDWCNFWGAVSRTGWYARSDDYMDIAHGRKRGVWNVPYVSGVVLVHRRAFAALRGAFAATPQCSDRDVNLCRQCRERGVFMYVSNVRSYGRLVRTHRFLIDGDPSSAEWRQRYLDPGFRRYLASGTLEDLVVHEPCSDVFRFALVTPTFCTDLVTLANRSDKWLTKHNRVQAFDHRIGGKENYPTVDVHLKDLGFRAKWEAIVRECIAPLVSKLYAPFKTSGLNIAFVVRYQPDEQAALAPHSDSSVYSINIALGVQGRDYEGGGTYFHRQKTVVRCSQGEAIVHPGRLTHRHSGLKTTRGTRHIFVSFVN